MNVALGYFCGAHCIDIGLHEPKNIRAKHKYSLKCLMLGMLLKALKLMRTNLNWSFSKIINHDFIIIRNLLRFFPTGKL